MIQTRIICNSQFCSINVLRFHYLQFTVLIIPRAQTTFIWIFIFIFLPVNKLHSHFLIGKEEKKEKGHSKSSSSCRNLPSQVLSNQENSSVTKPPQKSNCLFTLPDSSKYKILWIFIQTSVPSTSHKNITYTHTQKVFIRNDILSKINRRTKFWLNKVEILLAFLKLSDDFHFFSGLPDSWSLQSLHSVNAGGAVPSVRLNRNVWCLPSLVGT